MLKVTIFDIHLSDGIFSLVFHYNVDRYYPELVVNHLIKIIRIMKPYLVILAAIIICAILTYGNIRYSRSNQGGYDFLSNWQATRNFLFEGQSPYSETTTQEIQEAVYGRPAEAGEAKFQFTIPLYGIILYWPFALVKDFVIARALWMTLLEISIIGILLLCVRLTNWKIRPLALSALILFSFLGFNGVIPLLDGNAIILTTLLATGILVAIRNHQDELAGLLLAFCTISPIPVVLLFIYMIVWLVTNHRTKVIKWFMGTIILFIGFSVALIPNWIFQFLRNFIGSYNAIDPGSPGQILAGRWGDIGSRFSIIITIIIGIIIIIEWWQAKRAGEKRFVWTALLTLALSTWSGIKISPVSYLMLYPALILGLELLCERWKYHAYGFVFSIIALLFLSNWGIFFFTMSAELQTGISSYLFIPLPITTIILLYWSKWWVRKSNSIDFDPNLIELQKL